ncbi:MAG TPA: ABC transporter permease [Bryobacteraceae bacterium]|nr:ABC transporter permease [Bryobacteraceae bacterium]
MESLWNDLRYSVRALGRDRGFATVAILTLALGIGANTAIFSVVNSVILRPLTYRAPDRLVSIHEVIPKVSNLYPELPVNPLHFLEWRKRCASFEQIAELGTFSPNLTGVGQPEQLDGARVSANFFSMMGVQPQLGRGFLEEEDRPGHGDVVIMSNSLWQRRFGADPSIVGKKITLGGSPHIVVGVLPASFHFPKGKQLDMLMSLPERAEVFKPLALDLKDAENEGNFNYFVVGRLKDGVTRERALAEMNVVQADIAKTFKDKTELKAVLSPLQDKMVGPVRRGLLVLLGAVGSVLLIVCVNLANLSLVRGAARSRESAIRTALGAGRAQLLRQPLIESLLPAVLGGALGVILAGWGLNVLIKSAPVDLPRIDEVRLDSYALAFALAISTITGLLFGVLPALRMTRVVPQEVLKTGGRSSTEGLQGTRLRGLLVSTEVALSAVLLIVAGLLISSFVRLMNVDKGFPAERLLTADLRISATRYKEDASRVDFVRRVLTGVQALPGVGSAAVTNGLPLQGETWVDLIWLPGDTRPMFERLAANSRFVSPDYFKTAGIPLRAGRPFEEGDRKKDLVIVAQRTADQLWPGQNPLGKRLYRGDEKQREVIGVVGDVRTSLQQGPVVTVYFPYWEQPLYSTQVLVRTAMDPRSVAAALRSEIWKVDPEIPVPMKTMDELISIGAAPRRFQMMLVLLFAATALLLASLGIYGVVSYTVAQRTNEIGVRVALGARSADVYRMVLRQGLAPVAFGLIAGVAGALALGRLLSSLLFEVSPADPLTITTVTAALAAVGAFACTVPALRATRVDPMSALRYE